MRGILSHASLAHPDFVKVFTKSRGRGAGVALSALVLQGKPSLAARRPAKEWETRCRGLGAVGEGSRDEASRGHRGAIVRMTGAPRSEPGLTAEPSIHNASNSLYMLKDSKGAKLTPAVIQAPEQAENPLVAGGRVRTGSRGDSASRKPSRRGTGGPAVSRPPQAAWLPVHPGSQGGLAH
jgi:hypothetical protein